LFNFEDVGLKEVMRQLERWYDIEVVYEKDVPDIRFEGEISRNINLSNLLKVLARAEVKFRIEDGRRLVVLP
jgi:type II secretory pathway component GspD/PulD (secretin)